MTTIHFEVMSQKPIAKFFKVNLFLFTANSR